MTKERDWTLDYKDTDDRIIQRKKLIGRIRKHVWLLNRKILSISHEIIGLSDMNKQLLKDKIGITDYKIPEVMDLEKELGKKWSKEFKKIYGGKFE